jgi:hypothetical protein
MIGATAWYWINREAVTRLGETVSDYDLWTLTSSDTAECPDCEETVSISGTEPGNLGALLDEIDAHECGGS